MDEPREVVENGRRSVIDVLPLQWPVEGDDLRRFSLQRDHENYHTTE